MSVRLEHIEKRYEDGTLAVRDMNFVIERGEFFTLLGPSGCGKTSTLRMVAGLEDPTHGRIYIDGKDVTEVDPGKRDVALVFQSYALYPHMTVMENLTLGLRARGVSKTDARVRATQTAETLGLEPFLNKKPGKLSGGQRQRVALGRAIVRKPALFLMDEPLSNLDLKLREQMRTELKRLHQAFGITTIYVTHDQSEALILSDRVAVLRDGEVQQVGTPIAVYDYPRNRFVAEFIGSPGINLLAGEVEDGDVRVGSHGVGTAPHCRDGPAIVGVRPENVLLGEPAEGPLRGIVDLVEPNGAVVFAFINLDGHERVLRGSDRIVASVDAHAGVKPGQRVSLRLREGSLRLFDPNSDAAFTDTSTGVNQPLEASESKPGIEG